MATDSVGACCCEAVLPSISLHQPVLDLALSSASLCCSVTPSLLSVLVQTALTTSSAASGRCSRMFPSRGLVELCSAEPCPSVTPARQLLRSFSTWFQRVSVVAVAPLRLLQAPLLSRCPFHESVLPLRMLTWPSASRACGTDFLSPLRCFACVAVLMQCPPRFGSCPSPRHHSSLFTNCLFEQLDTVDVSARPRVNVLHWQRS